MSAPEAVAAPPAAGPATGPPSVAAAGPRVRPWLGLLRLTAGLVLFAYVATHYLNHAAGLVSLD